MVKIVQEAITNKALSHSNDNSFVTQDVTPLVQRTQVQPRLLTAIFGSTARTEYLKTSTLKYDELLDTLQIPTGKAYSDSGKDIQKDKPRELIYSVPSFGIRANVAPQDYIGRRIPGTNDLMDESYLAARMASKMESSWTLFNELMWAQLLNTDTNILLGGPHASYNYYTDIVGIARPAAIDVDLGGANDPWENTAKQKRLLLEDIEKTYNSYSKVIVICDPIFFAKRLELEKQENLARPVRGLLDLQTMGVPASTFGIPNSTYDFRHFESDLDGLTYIEYAAGILGTKIMADNTAKMLPVGADNFTAQAFAPAHTRTYANTDALPLYAWSKEHEKTGVTMDSEKNVLPLLINPQLIRHLTSST